MSEGQKLTASQVAAQQMSGLSANVGTQAKQAVQTAQRAPGIIQAARDASLQTTARTAGRSAALGRQAGGWGMGSSMQALAANLSASDQLAGQRASFATQEQEARQAGAQAALDESMFAEQRAQESAAATTTAINAVNSLHQNVMSGPRDQWAATGIPVMEGVLFDANQPLEAKLQALNYISRYGATSQYLLNLARQPQVGLEDFIQYDTSGRPLFISGFGQKNEEAFGPNPGNPSGSQGGTTALYDQTLAEIQALNKGEGQ